MNCKNCGKEIDSQNNFCPYCGTKVIKNIKSQIINNFIKYFIHYKNFILSKFCPYCGEKINKKNNRIYLICALIFGAIIVLCLLVFGIINYKNSHNHLYKILKNGEYIFINEKGKEIFSLKKDDYDFVGDFHEGRLFVAKNGHLAHEDDSGMYWAIYKDEKLTLFDTKGKIIKQFEQNFDIKDYEGDIEGRDERTPIFKEGIAIGKLGENEYVLINKSGNIITKIGCSNLRNFYNGLAEFEKNEKYGFINKKGEIKIPALYDGVWDFEDGLAPVKLNNKWGVINNKNEFVIPAQYDYVVERNKGYYKMAIGSHYYNENGYTEYIFDRNGKQITNENVLHKKYDLIPTKDGRIAFSDGLGGYIIPPIKDSQAFIQSDIFYNDANFYNGLASIYYESCPEDICESKIRFIKKNGKFLNNEIYTYAEPFKHKLSYVCLDDKYEICGYINTKGKWVYRK